MLGRTTIKGKRSANLVTGLLIMAVAVLLVTGYAMSATMTPMTYTGKVVAIDSAAKTFTVQSVSLDRLTFGLHEGAKLLRCEKEVAFNDIKVGDEVSIRYQESAGRYIADNINLSPEKC